MNKYAEQNKKNARRGMFLTVPQIRRWVKALRSGQYLQAQDGLVGNVYDDDMNFVGQGYCCLGVKNKVLYDDAEPENSHSPDNDMGDGYGPEFGLTNDLERKFANMNDDRGWGFPAIANHIERWYLP